MFTGIIETIGTITGWHAHEGGAQITVRPDRTLDDVQLGHSVAIDGICLTVIALLMDAMRFDISSETLNRSTIGFKSIGDRVHMERAMHANGRFGGHFVSGHIDETGTIDAMIPSGNSIIYRIKLSSDGIQYCIPKGSIAVSGVSLTIASLTEQTIDLALIPHSLQETTLRDAAVGDIVNIEYDMIAKYLKKYTLPAPPIATDPGDDAMTRLLTENGFI